MESSSSGNKRVSEKERKRVIEKERKSKKYWNVSLKQRVGNLMPLCFSFSFHSPTDFLVIHSLDFTTISSSVFLSLSLTFFLSLSLSLYGLVKCELVRVWSRGREVWPTHRNNSNGWLCDYECLWLNQGERGRESSGTIKRVGKRGKENVIESKENGKKEEDKEKKDRKWTRGRKKEPLVTYHCWLVDVVYEVEDFLAFFETFFLSFLSNRERIFSSLKQAKLSFDCPVVENVSMYQRIDVSTYRWFVFQTVFVWRKRDKRDRLVVGSSFLLLLSFAGQLE